jgi:hypothetical protein
VARAQPAIFGVRDDGHAADTAPEYEGCRGMAGLMISRAFQLGALGVFSSFAHVSPQMIRTGSGNIAHVFFLLVLVFPAAGLLGFRGVPFPGSQGAR